MEHSSLSSSNRFRVAALLLSSSLSYAYGFLWLLIVVAVVEASHEIYPPEVQSLDVDATDVRQVYRTGFHFQPTKHWMNAPMYYKGVYHLFYQYNPKGAVWGNIVWAHSVSKDLINWEALDPAIYPSKPFDINGCWSGSATILPGEKPVILYTGLDTKQRQVQNIALPANASDPYLRAWVKPDYNPVVEPSADINASLFRDPTTAWWNGGQWKILVGGSTQKGDQGMAYLYRSMDFKKWIQANHPLHSAPNTGMWECPDFYPVQVNGQNGLDTSKVGPGVKHVLKVSLDETRFEYYTIGTYDYNSDTFAPQDGSVDGRAGLRYDYGNFYASKTFFDCKTNRRILWGWVNESSTKDDNIKKGWAGIQAIPRTVLLDGNGKQLVQWPVEEVEKLRMNKVEISKLQLGRGEHVEIKGITAAQADVEVIFSFSPPSLEKAEPFDPRWVNMDAQSLCGLMGSTVQGGLGPFGLLTLASKDLDEYTPVFFRVFKTNDNKHVVLMCSDASRFRFLFCLISPFFVVFSDLTHCLDARSSSLYSKLYKPSFGGFVDVSLGDGKLALRSLIDNSVVESFGAGGKTVITSRVYPTKALCTDAHLFVFNNGTESITIQNLDAWSMQYTSYMNDN
ncbi:Invertase [Dionaea muscipula]